MRWPNIPPSYPAKAAPLSRGRTERSKTAEPKGPAVSQFRSEFKSDRLALPFDDRVLRHRRHALPAVAVETGNHVALDALHELVVHRLRLHRLLRHEGARRQPAGARIERLVVDRGHGVLRLGDLGAQFDELLGLCCGDAVEAVADRGRLL